MFCLQGVLAAGCQGHQKPQDFSSQVSIVAAFYLSVLEQVEQPWAVHAHSVSYRGYALRIPITPWQGIVRQVSFSALGTAGSTVLMQLWGAPYHACVHVRGAPLHLSCTQACSYFASQVVVCWCCPSMSAWLVGVTDAGSACIQCMFLEPWQSVV